MIYSIFQGCLTTPISPVGRLQWWPEALEQKSLLKKCTQHWNIDTLSVLLCIFLPFSSWLSVGRRQWCISCRPIYNKLSTVTNICILKTFVNIAIKIKIYLIQTFGMAARNIWREAVSLEGHHQPDAFWQAGHPAGGPLVFLPCSLHSEQNGWSALDLWMLWWQHWVRPKSWPPGRRLNKRICCHFNVLILRVIINLNIMHWLAKPLSN